MYQREKRYVTLVVFATTLYGLIQTTAHIYGPFETSPLMQYGLVAVTFTILFFGRYRIFSSVIKLIDWQFTDKQLPTDWSIHIEFEEDGLKNIRFGHFKLLRTVVGLKIEGHHLHDAIDKSQTMRKWDGREVLYLDRSATEVLVYIYQTFEQGRDEEDRIGVVVAGKPKGDGHREYVGSFHDYSSADPQKNLRHGTVRLTPD